jgi:N-acetylmuramoyl-L-alanine amidase
MDNMARFFTPLICVFLIVGSGSAARAQPPIWAPAVIEPTDSSEPGSPVAAPVRQLKQPPILVQNIRVQTSAQSTTLVFDLQRQVQVQHRRGHHPEQFILELQNTRLSPQASARLANLSIPDSISVRQAAPAVHSKARTVLVTMTNVTNYRVSPLTKPPRLVVEVVNRKEAGETTPLPPSQAKPSPAQDEAPPSPKPSPPGNGVKLIVIDPGHGGRDPGAVGHGGTEEKRVTLRVGLLLRDLIAQQVKKPVLMTRDRDIFVELDDRAKFANSRDADLFVSIHVNSHPQRSTKGLEIYHFGEASDRRALEVAARENGTPISETGVGWQYLVADLLTTKKIQDSLDLAWHTKEAVVSRLKDVYDVDDHGVKTAPFYVLRFTSMPSILAEIAFISNPGEEKLMQTDAFLTRMAEGILDGIRSYLNPSLPTGK